MCWYVLNTHDIYTYVHAHICIQYIYVILIICTYILYMHIYNLCVLMKETWTKIPMTPIYRCRGAICILYHREISYDQEVILGAEKMIL